MKSQSQPSKTRFVSLEGIDFTWKSPISKMLIEELERRGYNAVLTRDPPYWLSPWDNFKACFEEGDSFTRLAEAFLLLSARLDNFERVISPALAKGHFVISDRYVDSWFAYQSVRLAHYFGGELKALDFLLNQHQMLLDNGFLSYPSTTILIRDNPTQSLARAKPDEIGSKYDHLEIQQSVARMYDIIAQMFNQRILIVEIGQREIQQIYSDTLKIVEKTLLAPTREGEE